MDFKSFIGALRDLVDAAGQDVTDGSPTPAPTPPAVPGSGALLHSIDTPPPSSVPSGPHETPPSTPTPAPTPPAAVPGSGALPHSIDVPAIGNNEPVLVGAAPAAAAPVVTPDPMPTDPATANFEQLIAPSSVRHEVGDVIFDGEYGQVVSVRREGVIIGRFARVDGPIADV